MLKQCFLVLIALALGFAIACREEASPASTLPTNITNATPSPTSSVLSGEVPPPTPAFATRGTTLPTYGPQDISENVTELTPAGRQPGQGSTMLPTVAPTLIDDPEATLEESPTATPLSELLPLRLVRLDLEEAFPDLEDLPRMVHLTYPSDGSGRLFVVLQEGKIVVFPGERNVSDAVDFLDIRQRVNSGGEQGLLGLAFDPNYSSNGYFYVNYTTQGNTLISRFSTDSADPGRADASSELVLMRIPQPFPNHNGGTLAFGHDGYLYIGLGDGGGGGDPLGSGQDLTTLLGAMLRIDVLDASPDRPYAIPPDNPFVHFEARGEIWAYGLRNPWRFSFDRQNGDLWAGDVGQNSFEEVDLVQRGGNYGWNTLEGNHCFSPRTGCDPSGTLLPVIEYGSDKGCSVIGGYVYRGTAIPSLAGTYLYGDFCSGEVHGFRFENGEVAGHSLLVDSGFMITSFGEDQQGEIYALSQDGGIYRLKADG
ncbi:MAG: PQQ-dependent sugar dehydrogenase [Chloroflexi bacterium]|nr:PQQ-dependent sugar dehydrogenase [Chloroflexota bacterium]